jgi:hypothetical protein
MEAVDDDHHSRKDVDKEKELQLTGIFTHGYPFTLPGIGYGKNLYPLIGMGTGDR